VVTGLNGTPVSDLSPTDGQVLQYNNTDGKWVPQTLSAASGGVSEAYYAVDPSDFVGIRFENQNYNIAMFEDDIRYVTILDRDKGDEIIAPLHLPHNAELLDMDVIFKKMAVLYDMEIALQRKNMYTGSTTNLHYWNTYLSIPMSGMRVHSADLTVLSDEQRTIDNSQYSYRIVVKFDLDNHFSEASDVEVMLYNVRMKYEIQE